MSESVILSVTGMKCGGCEANITSKLGELDGVATVKASSKDQQVQIDFDAAKTSLAEIKQTITDAGFTVISV